MTMADPESSADEPEIQADEEWKQQVKAEDAALDEAMKAEASKEPATASSAADASATNDAATNDVATDDVATDDVATDDVATDDVATDDVAASAAKSQPMPPPTFEVLVGMFSTQAMVALGIIPNPATGKAELLPDLAKHFIDMLSVLETKTAGNLEPHEKTLLDSSLHQLRMTYVQATKK